MYLEDIDNASHITDSDFPDSVHYGSVGDFLFDFRAESQKTADVGKLVPHVVMDEQGFFLAFGG